ncbi:hypothetical protein ACE1AT_07380 [Pelatocladus sp. BLCC-F211]|uniref:hypothetical protein n=1 Tax=Pelatocladus sp. BLCC-F211 TaxID=3342752 RepID=UPI0035BA5C1F
MGKNLNLRQIAWNSETMPYYTPETFTPQGLGLIVWTTNNPGLTTFISVLDTSYLFSFFCLSPET